MPGTLKIAVMGSGGVGGYFGGRLAQAGEDVAFIARGPHLDALRGGGLKVESPLGDFTVAPIRATDDPSEVGPVDIVLFAVKLYDTDTAAEQARPLIGPDTAVVSLQNGVEGVEVLRRVFGERHVMGGVAHIAAVIAAPGVIRHGGRMAHLTFGELDGRESERVAALLAACGRAGIEAVASTDISRDMWTKFVFLSAFSAVTSVTRRSIGPILRDPDTRALYEAALGETVAVARARGVKLADDAVAEVLAFTDGLDPGMKSSMLGDLERGKRLELHHLSGAVVRLGRELGVPTPVHGFVVVALKLAVQGAA